MFRIQIENWHTPDHEVQVHYAYDIETRPVWGNDRFEVIIGQRHFDRRDSGRVLTTDRPIIVNDGKSEEVAQWLRNRRSE